jgi:hypothetical protein
MERLLILYSFFLVIFCSMTFFLILGSPHHAYTSLVLFNWTSVISFPVTVYLLIRYFLSKKYQWITAFFLGINCVIFYYYTYVLFITNNDGMADIALALVFPVVNFLLSLFFLTMIIKNILKVEKH